MKDIQSIVSLRFLSVSGSLGISWKTPTLACQYRCVPSASVYSSGNTRQSSIGRKDSRLRTFARCWRKLDNPFLLCFWHHLHQSPHCLTKYRRNLFPLFSERLSISWKNLLAMPWESLVLRSLRLQ